MAAQGSRTLKLSLLADVAEFTKGIKTAGKDTESIGDQFTAFGKKAALAFAAAATAIGAYAKVAIENAAADEKAQRNLALTIENTTTATAAQIAGVEKYISATSVAIGVTDDELRPAFARLVRSTKDVEDAQKLLNLALDISSATGKPLEAVANALGKAYDGNLASLGRLGLGIDQSILKSKDFDLVFNTLTETFGGFADNEAQSAEKAFARIKIASDEVQEQIGAALLPVIQELTTFILTDVVPVVQSFVNGLTGDDGLTDGLSKSQVSAIAWGKKIRELFEIVIKFKDELIVLTAVIAGVFVTSKIAAGVTATILLINSMIKAYNLLKASAIVASVTSAFALNPLLGVGVVALGASVLAGANALAGRSNTPEADLPGAGGGGFSGTLPNGQPFVSGSGAAGGGGGGTSSSSTIPKVTIPKVTTPKIAVPIFDSGRAGNYPSSGFPGSDTSFDPNRVGMTSGGATINLTVNGAIDSEGTARTIINTLNDSFYRGTGGSGNFVSVA
jgi:hypothetical protein